MLATAPRSRRCVTLTLTVTLALALPLTLTLTRTACYGHIREVLRLVGSAAAGEAEGGAVPLYEVKRVAEFVSGKLCRAMLEAGKHQEAYDTFRRHTRAFTPRIHPTPDSRPPPVKD